VLRAAPATASTLSSDMVRSAIRIWTSAWRSVLALGRRLRRCRWPRPSRRRLRTLVLTATATVLAAGGLVQAVPASAAGETVNIWLTSTNDSGGRNVTRGLQQQAPVTFASGNGSSGVSITVNENTRYQQFVGAGAIDDRIPRPIC